MGTSTARRGPRTAAWRVAKAAASRYLAPESAQPPAAREVVRRYLAALTETSAQHDLLASFRLTRQAAQHLGEFGEMAATGGWPAALQASGLAGLAQEPPETIFLGLAAAWVKEDGGLEAAVARTALFATLTRWFGGQSPAAPLDPALLVKTFLGLALSRRLLLDVGEALEAAAPTWTGYQGGLARLEEEVDKTAAAVPAAPPSHGQWPGLEGWGWVSQVLAAILQGFRETPAS